MSEKLKFFISNSDFLTSIFSNSELASRVDITVCNSENEILQLIDKGQLPDAILLGNDFVQKTGLSFLENLNEHTTVQQALKSDFITYLPTLVIQKKEDVSEEISLLNAGAVAVLPSDMNPKLFFIRIKNIILSITNASNKFNSLNTQHKKAIDRILELSEKTGIYNKAAFIKKTQAYLNANIGSTVSFIRFDLDRFKVFNDIFGFSEGDKILEKIGEAFLHTPYKNITYGHIYADHFIICVNHQLKKPDEAVKLITNFVNSLHKNFNFIVRIGICELQNNGNIDVSQACDHAQLALQSIKTDFTARYAFYSPEMINDLKQEQELMTDMVKGIKENEFQVYLQPQYDYTTDSLTGAEALVRWFHPTKGLISPGVFIPIFERNGFIVELDEYIWDKTCSLIREWLDEGLNPVPISVNISRRDIYNPELVNILTNLLKKYNLETKLLRLEITESAYMDNPAQLIKVVQELRNHGFCLEMDDFGSGYSSLNTLKDVPVDVLKLDMKFIMAATEHLGKNNSSESSARSGSILSSVVRMANWLRLPVIAEGIESKEQADYLKSIGCFNMQGFYFAKPMPAEEYKELLFNLPLSREEENTGNSSIKDAISFMDATTQNNLLFNNFIGGAAIIEWTGSNIEIIRMNDLYLEELGTTQDYYSQFQKNITTRLDSASRPVFISTLAESTKSNKLEFCEVLCRPLYAGNQPFWMRVNIRHLSKTVTSDIFFMSIENIDFRMQLLQLNTNLSEQLATMMENIPCGVITLDYNGEFVTSYINETTSKICGYEQSEFRVKMAKDFLFAFTPAERENFHRYLKDILNAKLPAFTTKSAIMCKNGTEKRIQISGNILQRSDGSIYVSAVLVDINELERNHLTKYTSFIFSMFNEVFEMDFLENTSKTIKSNFMVDYKQESKPLDKTINYWAEKFVIEEDRNKFLRFISIDHITRIDGDLSICDYRIIVNNNIEYLRSVIVPTGNGKYLCCSTNITSQVAKELI